MTEIVNEFFPIVENPGDDDLIPIFPLSMVGTNFDALTRMKFFVKKSSLGNGGGVTVIIAGNGISVDQATGDVTVTNTQATSESITSGADPVAADPDVAFTVWTTGGTKGTETVTLADPSDPTKPFIKTFQIVETNGANQPSLSVTNCFGFTSPITIYANTVGDHLSAILQLCWNPSVSKWQALVGGPIFTNGYSIDTGGGHILAHSGDVDAATYSVGGLPGVDGSGTVITQITVSKGLITAISVA